MQFGQPAYADRKTNISTKAKSGKCDYHQVGQKHLYWGDLHVHTAYSLDAYAFGTLKTPAQAYAFARGDAMTLQDGSTAQLDRPLDFAAVTDHAEWFDLLHICTGPQNFDDPYCERLRKDSSMENGSSLFVDYVIPTITQEAPQATPICIADPVKCVTAKKSQWQRVQDQANAANDPCNFTAQIGYEWSYTKSFSHSHRNIIFANDKVTQDAIDYIRHPTLSDLWTQLEQQCRAEDGCEALAIPHNTNMGDGMTFDVEADDERTLQLRSKYERLVEIHQEKGNSECLSPLKTDESADCNFENYITNHSRPKAKLEFTDEQWTKMRGTYVRGLLMRGLASYQNSGKAQLNPLQMGIIGSTDNHAGTPGHVNEAAWQGAVFGLGDLDRTMARSAFNPGGLVAVWAEENTRESIFAALKRREVYATSGPRISVRLSANTQGENLSCATEKNSLATVSMGGDFNKALGAPTFRVHAQADQTPLQEMQLIKGQYKNGKYEESVMTIWQRSSAGSDICQIWQDQNFEPEAPAFWYARIKETPTPRWSANLCQKAGRCEEFAGADVMIQERAWTSPIWYLPKQ
ncbi:DUF3604 domain-containing protein [Pseudomonadales bacterium]|nr:DUF3604 domain-containing protein [Pseudomonadales bacterium]